MSDYIEQLKIHWQTEDLTLIATLNKSLDNSHGYFRDFINPLNKKKLSYPTFEGVEIDDQRISFFWGDIQELVNGDYYQVRLEYTDKPKGKNNPFSLRIKNVLHLDQNEVQALLTRRTIKKALDSSFYFGCYRQVNTSIALFKNVMHSETGTILLRDREPLNVFVDPKIQLKENQYYSFSIKENLGNKLPSAISSTIKEIEVNPYKEFIRLRFERLNNPEANKMIANLMREIGKGMYSSKQRMIFELLQNADDAPGKEKIEFHIDINGPYFFVMHDGAPFNKDDVEAITSAAESTKRGDNKKTGYKGIGFKSVFTDSTEVWINSGGYQFAFQRSNDFFNDFDKFYFSSERYKKYPELLEEDKLKYRNQRLRFNGSTDIPWQVIPIWHDQLPDEFNYSNFNNFDNPVQFALKVGINNIISEDGYLAAIDNIVKRPQFLLFLRNTSKFRSSKNRVTVSRTDNNNLIEIKKTIVTYINNEIVQQPEVFDYVKKVYSDISVSDEAFASLNVGIKKFIERNDLNEDITYFVDLDGDKIETIPPKLATSTETEISFGIFLLNKKISSERDYFEGLPKYSSLFTYLPMEDTRFQLPFLVNADFVPSSDRQKIQGDNPWNKYIMIKIAEKHVCMLNYFASQFQKTKGIHDTYLSLLLKNTLPDDDTAQHIIYSYNVKYLEQLEATPIVTNDLNVIQLISETIIDNSGLITLFGEEIFYQIIDTDKRLPHVELEVSSLKNYKYLNVEQITIKELAQNLTPGLCKQLGDIIAQNKLYSNSKLLKWLNDLVEYIPELFGKIPFIIHNNALFSIETLLLESDAWIINKNTSEYDDLFKDLGYNTINLELEKYTNLNNFLFFIGGYINDKALAYERIESTPNLSTISISTKLRLIDFFKSAPFMLGIGANKYFGELKLFVDEKGISRPLNQLISLKGNSEVKSILPFQIKENEYNSLNETLKKELIKNETLFNEFILNRKLFDEWSLQFNEDNIEQYINSLRVIYSWKDENIEVMQSQWSLIPWVYINDEFRFVESNKAYWSDSYNEMSSFHYNTLKNIMHNFKLKVLPMQECSEIINLFSLNTDNVPISNWECVKEIDPIISNILLDWMEADGSYNDFFTKYTFSKSSERKWSIVFEDKQVFDSSDVTLKTYIEEIDLLSTLFTGLDLELCTDNRGKIGLLQGDKLSKAIIETKVFNQRLASYLPQTLNWKLFEAFIVNLPEFNLEINVEYSFNAPEHMVLSYIFKNVENIEEVPDNIQFVIDTLRGKIKIKGDPLDNYDLSDRIHFGKGENRKILKLSNVLQDFKGESDVLDKIIEAFVGITNKTKLKMLVFKTRLMPLSDVCTKIEFEQSEFYSEYQIVFQLLASSIIPNFKWSKKHFDTYWEEKGDKSALHNCYKKFLDIIFEIQLTNLTGFYFLELDLENCVDKNWAVDSEMIPNWLEEWISNDSTNRSLFISKLGYNSNESSIVKLRQEAISENYDRIKVISFYEETRKNTQLTRNTIVWLSKYSSEIVTKNIELIKLINNQVTNDDLTDRTIIIPVIENIDKEGDRVYRLRSVSVDCRLLFLNKNQDLSFRIYQILSQNDEQTHIVDDVIGTQLTYFASEIISLKASLDSDLLSKNSKLWEEPFYKKWEHYHKYPIYVYKDGEIPYMQTFNDIVISCYTRDLKVESLGVYYVSSIVNRDILNNLPSAFPKDILNDLKDWHYKTLKNESLLDEDSFDYKESIDRLLQDKLGISDEAQKTENGNAKTHAIYFLDEKGYDISNAINAGASLKDIIDPDGNKVNCIVRSAKGGLLYLDKGHWDMLEDFRTYLLVIYPGNTPRLFKDRLELLQDDLAQNVLFRVSNSRLESEIDGVFDRLESDAHLILVTSEKMKEELFPKLKNTNHNKGESDVAVTDEDFNFDSW